MSKNGSSLTIFKVVVACFLAMTIAYDGVLTYAILNPTVVNKITNTETDQKGEKGDKGDTGPQGEKGDKGDKGDTGAQGPKGDQGEPGQNGATGQTGPQGPAGQNGTNGTNGQDGISIVKIEKTNTSGLIDTYTITYSNGETSMFIVTNGAEGPQGIQGVPGNDGVTPTIEINNEGYWVINGVTSNVKAEGVQGPQGPQGVAGTNGSSMLTGNGEPAQGLGSNKDSYLDFNTWNYYVKEDGVWVLKGTIKGDKGDTGATGQTGPQGPAGQNGTNGTNGADGVSIASVEKTSTEGLVDTYTITYSNGDKSYFTVTNGANGENGAAGANGTNGIDGHSPEISIGANGNWFIDGVDTGKAAQGEQGQAGTAGTNGADGVSITSVELINSDGLVDTYRINFSNGTHYDYQITNGATGAQGPKGDQGDPGQNGTNGTNGADGKSVTAGEGLPNDDNGTNGDSYIDIDTWNYYVKESGSWVLKGNIKGADGSNGHDGENGVAGAAGADGNDGISITNAAIDLNGDLIVYFSDGTETNAGHIRNTEEFTVEFYCVGNNGLAKVDEQQVMYGGKVSIPTEDKIGGYDLYANDPNYASMGFGIGGWYVYDVASQYIEPWNFNGCTVTSDLMLVALYSAPKTFGITFVDDDYGHTSFSHQVTYGDTFDTSLLEPWATGVLGWEDGNGQAFDLTSPYLRTNSITLHAVWGAPHTLTYLDPLYLNASGSVTVTTGARYDDKLPTFTAESHDFLGWEDENGDLVDVTQPYSYDRDLTLTARWVIKSNYNQVNLDANGGMLPIDNPVLYLEEGSNYTLPFPTMDEEIFLGWYDQSNNLIPSFGTNWSYGSVSLTAHWQSNSTPNKYIIDPGIGEYTLPTSITLSYGDSYDLGTPIAPYGAQFLGWSYYGQTIPASGTWSKSEASGIIRAIYNDNSKYLIISNNEVIGLSDDFPGGKVGIPNTVTSIAEDAFRSKTTLTGVSIPSSVEIIDNNAFKGCNKLQEVILHEGLETIGDGAFGSCSKLESITIPDSVTLVGESAFSANTSLTTVVIGDGLTALQYGTFAACSALTSVTLGNNIATIGHSAFYSCSALQSIVIPDSVVVIHSCAFMNCNVLTSVVLGSSLNSIYSDAFNKSGDYTNSHPIQFYYHGTKAMMDYVSFNFKTNHPEQIWYYCDTDIVPPEPGQYWHYDSLGNVSPFTFN